MEIILFETLIRDLVLKAYPLSSDEDIQQYKKFLRLFPNNPLYNIELLSFGMGPHEELMYFAMMQNGSPLVLMPFWFRKVIFNGKETGYYDISSPYGYSGPIFARNIDRKIAVKFWREVDFWYKKNKVVSEFIRFNMQENWTHYTGQIKPTLNNVRGKILPPEEQWDNFKPKVRNNFRKSLKFGLRSTVYHDIITDEVIEQFHNIYARTMERTKAISQYCYDLDYFKNLIFNNPLSCAIILVYKDETPISTELLLLSDTTINSFLGGTDEDYFYTRPNDFLKLEVLKWGREKGFAYYFLGGGRENNDSLYHYKKNFFPLDTDAIFYTGRKIIDKEGYNTLVSNNPNCSVDDFQNYFPIYRLK
tara:strand:+ start:3455 stop:4540 length:1086 start_codon:yes stop_codon:yes gene_type:complete